MGREGRFVVSASRFDALIHAPNRLQICAFLAATAEMEFRALRDQLSVSDSVLSKQIKLLEEAEYVVLDKRAHNGRQRTWLSLSSKGRQAFAGHVKELRNIVG